MIILHYTGMKTAKDALERLCDPQSEVSAHYLIEENGKTHQLVEDQYRAWHAGAAYWNKQTDINSLSFGIELVNPGHEFGYREFKATQIKALRKLLKTLCEEHSIPNYNIIGHSDIAPERKTDPGELFPWEPLSKQGFGIWPYPIEMDYQNAQDILLNTTSIKEALANFGYNPSLDLPILVNAFHRHYYPEKFKSGNNPDETDVASIAKLLNLTRQKFEILQKT